MHTDEDGTNLPISLARPELLAHTGGTHMHVHTPEQTEVMQGNWIPKTVKDVDFLRPRSTDNGLHK